MTPALGRLHTAARILSGNPHVEIAAATHDRGELGCAGWAGRCVVVGHGHRGAAGCFTAAALAWAKAARVPDPAPVQPEFSGI